MTTLELKLTLPDGLAEEAREAGLLTSEAISELLKEAMRRRAGQALLGLADRVAAAGIEPLSLEEIQVEVMAVRMARRKPRAPRH